MQDREGDGGDADHDEDRDDAPADYVAKHEGGMLFRDRSLTGTVGGRNGYLYPFRPPYDRQAGSSVNSYLLTQSSPGLICCCVISRKPAVLPPTLLLTAMM